MNKRQTTAWSVSESWLEPYHESDLRALNAAKQRKTSRNPHPGMPRKQTSQPQKRHLRASREVRNRQNPNHHQPEEGSEEEPYWAPYAVKPSAKTAPVRGVWGRRRRGRSSKASEVPIAGAQCVTLSEQFQSRSRVHGRGAQCGQRERSTPCRCKAGSFKCIRSLSGIRNRE